MTLTFLVWVYAIATLILVCWRVLAWHKQSQQVCVIRAAKRRPGDNCHPIRSRRKPAWVTDELIRLKAHLPEAGCRTLAMTFNRLFADLDESVGKTWVAQTIQKHRYEIRVLRRKIKKRPAYDVPKGKYWGIDLTQVADAQKHQHTIFGVCEHHSRFAIVLKQLPNKASITLLRCLLDAIDQFGKPQIIRTDNEAVFISRLFRFGLWFLGIRHQTTDTHFPGRMAGSSGFLALSRPRSGKS